MAKTANEYLDDDIREEFSKHRSVFRTARALRVSLERVNAVVGDSEPFASERREMQYDGMGRPELQKFIVARKHSYEAWNNDSDEIRKARSQYEAGSHEMTQGRDGDFIILYSIPRAVPQPRPNYFKHGAD